MTPRQSTQRARQLRNDSTKAERHLWQRLRRKQLYGCKFRRQFPIGPYIVDFVCLKARLVIELDGGQHNRQIGYDQARDQWLEIQGFRVLRFWNDVVFTHTDEVLGQIVDALPPPFNPLPRRESPLQSPLPRRESPLQSPLLRREGIKGRG